MCDVCRLSKQDSYKLNGNNIERFYPKFFSKEAMSASSIQLCKYHDRQLFKLGERVFFKVHPRILRHLGVSSSESATLF